MTRSVWMIRAGEGASMVEPCIEGGYIGVGFGQHIFTALPAKTRREDLAQAYREMHPDWSENKIANASGQLFRFLVEVKVGDEVVTGDPARRLYYLGTIESEAEFVPGAFDALPFRRRVKWQRKALRDELSVETRNTLGAIQTLFKLNADASADLRQHAVDVAATPASKPRPAEPVAAKPEKEGRSIDELRREVIEKAQEFIEDLIARLDPYAMQDLVAGIMRAMGYKTRVSPKGSDRGVDIFASPDGLGLQEPRIFVEVKHRPNTQISAPDVRSFLGGRKTGDRCLYVSTGGFTKEARYEAERANVPLQLIDMPMLRVLLVEHYEQVDQETRRLVPLTKLYWPIEQGG
jgi:restriction system protein